MNIKKYFRNILISIDQFINTIFRGDPDETISSRWGKDKDKTLIAKVGCNVLDVIDKDHCEKSIEEDEGKNAV